MNDSTAHAAPSAARLSIRRLGVLLGAEITGIDLAKPLD